MFLRAFAIRFKQEHAAQYPQQFLNQDDKDHDETGAVYHSPGTAGICYRVDISTSTFQRPTGALLLVLTQTA
jgi:hypothetical protein